MSTIRVSSNSSNSWIWGAAGSVALLFWVLPRHGTSRIAWMLAIGFVAGATAFTHGFTVRQRRDMVKATPKSKIRSAAMGLVELEGKAQPVSKLFISPFTQEKAVYYRFLVVVKRHKREDVVLAQFESSEPFYIEDETGRALIMPANADLRFHVDHRYTAGVGGTPQDEAVIRAGLSRLGKLFPFLELSARVVCEETCILPGDPLYVLGSAEAATEALATAKDNTGPILVLCKKAGQYFCISDTPEQGVLEDFNAELAVCQFMAPVISVICLAFLLL